MLCLFSPSNYDETSLDEVTQSIPSPYLCSLGLFAPRRGVPSGLGWEYSDFSLWVCSAASLRFRDETALYFLVFSFPCSGLYFHLAALLYCPVYVIICDCISFGFEAVLICINVTFETSVVDRIYSVGVPFSVPSITFHSVFIY